MSRSNFFRGLAFLLLMSMAGPALAQGQPQADPDFLFARPWGSIGVRGGWLFERAGSDLFQFVQDQLTVQKNDFNSPLFAVDVAQSLTSRIDAVVGFEFAGSTTRSEYRDFVDDNRLPITQTTRLRQMNLSYSLRVALIPRGQQVGRLAWVPRMLAPYVGAGGGVLRYELKQAGDFVDFADLSVFSDTFRSSGWTPSAHVFGGVEINVSPRLFVVTEARYLRARTELGPDFSGFEPLDLTGLRTTVGVNYLF